MTDTTRSFEDFGVEQPIAAALADAGISTPFPIQELTLPLALSGADVIGQARTGTGKTLAFGIPLLQRADADAGYVQALVVVPTRELCLQVTGDLNQAGVRKGVDVAAVYGGRAIEPQEEAIAGGAAVVVGTPGRLLDLTRRGTLDLSRVTGLVLDEADEMLDLGFLPDVERLVEQTAAERQTLLFSATMPSQVVSLARRYMDKPTFLRADYEQVQVAPLTTQHFFSCHRMDKPAVLARILQTPHLDRALVFSRTKRMCDILAEELRTRGVRAAPIHSDLRQEARERALTRFRDGQIDVLIATEVAARGLDISNVTHVVNYDCPDDEKMYLHRVGRTGRAGATGIAITLTLWNELARLEMIKRALDITTETHEVFSTSPLLDELFDLPARTGRRAAVAETDDVDEQPVATATPARGRPGRRRGRGGTSDQASPGQPGPVSVPDVPETVEQVGEPGAAAPDPGDVRDEPAARAGQGRAGASTPVGVVTAVAEEIRGRVRRRRRRGSVDPDTSAPRTEATAGRRTRQDGEGDVTDEGDVAVPVPDLPATRPEEQIDGKRVRVRRRAGSAGRAPVPDTDGDEEIAGGRVREADGPPRDTRDDPVPAVTTGPDGDEDGDDDGSDDAPVRRRRRGERRAVQPGEVGSADEGGADEGGAEDDPPARPPARERDGRNGRGTRGGRSERTDAGGRGERGDSARTNERPPRDDRGRRRGRDGEARRAPATNRTRGGRGRTARGTTASSEPRRTRAAAAARPDAATARGTGRPMLQRPMLIDHLP